MLGQGKHYPEMDQSMLPLAPRDLKVPSGAPKMISESIAHSVQIVLLSWAEINTVSKWIKA
jgi:hypothetical protein